MIGRVLSDEELSMYVKLAEEITSVSSAVIRKEMLERGFDMAMGVSPDIAKTRRFQSVYDFATGKAKTKTAEQRKKLVQELAREVGLDGRYALKRSVIPSVLIDKDRSDRLRITVVAQYSNQEENNTLYGATYMLSEKTSGLSLILTHHNQESATSRTPL